MTYTLDTNILIVLNRSYPRDIFPSIWQALENAIDRGGVCICSDVLDELARGGDELHDWAKKYPGLVCDVSQNDVNLAAQISAAYPDWVREETNAADPFIVAHAANTKRSIVSEERRAGAGVVPKNQKIPNVADVYSVQTSTLFEWVRTEGWSF